MEVHGALCRFYSIVHTSVILGDFTAVLIGGKQCRLGEGRRFEIGSAILAIVDRGFEVLGFIFSRTGVVLLLLALPVVGILISISSDSLYRLGL